MVTILIKTKVKNRPLIGFLTEQLMHIITPIYDGCTYSYDGDKGLTINGRCAKEKESFSIASVVLNYATLYSKEQKWNIETLEVTRKHIRFRP